MTESAQSLESIAALLNHDDATVRQQGTELLRSLPALCEALFAGCRTTPNGKPRPGPAVSRHIHDAHQAQVTLWGLTHLGRLSPEDALDMSAIYSDVQATRMLSGLSALRMLRIRWSGTHPLDTLPAVSGLHLLVNGRRVIRGLPPPDWSLLASVSGLRALAIRVDRNRLLLPSFSVFDELETLHTLALTFFRSAGNRITIGLPGLRALSLVRLDTTGALTISTPTLAALDLTETNLQRTHIAAPNLESLTVQRNLALETLDLSGCPRLTRLRLRALPCLESVTVPAGCTVENTRAAGVIHRA